MSKMLRLLAKPGGPLRLPAGLPACRLAQKSNHSGVLFRIEVGNSCSQVSSHQLL